MATIALLAFKYSVLKLSDMRMMVPFTEDCPSSEKRLVPWWSYILRSAGIHTHSRNAIGTPYHHSLPTGFKRCTTYKNLALQQ